MFHQHALWRNRMASYRTTVILKTDIVDSTSRLAGQTQFEMGIQRKQHKAFIIDMAGKHHGYVFDEEGDAYWIEFPSVTGAVLAALDMLQSLQKMQAGKGERQRLAIRAVITAGDILYQDNDPIGTAMNLAARLEKMTPPDEIYLSHAAWLLLNKAEVQTAFIGEFIIKGFNEPEKIYKVVQKNWSRVITNQFIVFTDMRGWSQYTRSGSIEDVENILFKYDDLMNDTCSEHNGLVRNTSGDQYFLTFSDTEHFFSAIDNLCKSWRAMVDRYHLGLSISAHKGDLNIIRSYLYGNDIHTAVYLERLISMINASRESISVAVTKKIKDCAKGTRWDNRFKELNTSHITDDNLLAVVKEYGAFQFLF